MLDFAAYYRFVKARLERAIEQNRSGITTVAEPTAHCEICRWWQECDAEWRKQDHLSLVAGINRLQRKQLSAWEVTTVEQLEDWKSFRCQSRIALTTEGVVGKRTDSVYEPGERSGAWIKLRTNLEQEFVIGAFVPGARKFDALLVGV